VRVLSRLFRRLFLTALQQAFDAGQLRFVGSHQALADPQHFATHLRPAQQTEWVVYARRPFAGPQQVLDYVGRYTHRVAIANQRLIDVADGQVRFRYTDYRAQHQPKTMTLDAVEFMRRFLLHVLPTGFHRIRYYGLLGHRHRRAHLTQCRHLLGTATPSPIADEPRRPRDYRDRYETLTGRSLRDCPRCQSGHMHIVDSLAGPARRPIRIDSS
jgi:hypothetical protein